MVAPAVSVRDVIPGLSLLWSESLGDPEICLAVLDGPVDRDQGCFAGAQLCTRETLASGGAHNGAASAHGTHVASIIWGQPGSPVEGVAPRCRGLVVPVFADGPDGGIVPCSQIDMARAILQALEGGARIISIAGGELTAGAEPHELLGRAIRQCAESNTLIVAATGNNGCECLHVPAAVDSVLAVGAAGTNGQPLGSSNWGKAYRFHGIIAPGENIPDAVPGGGITLRSGSSFATAIVSGVAALLLSLQKLWGQQPDARLVQRAILEGARPCQGPDASCQRFLSGTFDISASLCLLRASHTRYGPVHKAGISPAPEVSAEKLDPDPESCIHNILQGAMIPMSEEPTLTTSENTVRIPAESVVPKDTPSATTNLAEPSMLRSEASPGNQGRVLPSDCGCGCKSNRPATVYALGQIGYDFGSEARRDSLAQHGLKIPHDPEQVLSHLASHPENAAGLVWTLSQETIPIYAVHPAGPFAAEGYQRLREFLQGQIREGVEMVSIPGYVGGKATLISGQSVPLIIPELRGMYSWSARALVTAVAGPAPAENETDYQQKASAYATRSAEVLNFLERVYYEIRNLGLTSQERAINYAATNAFQIEHVYSDALQSGLRLDAIGVEKSPLARPGSDMWDVKLTFFHPTERLEQSRLVYRFTVDVTDVVPVTVGKVRSWHVY